MDHQFIKSPEKLESEFDTFFSRLGYQRITEIVGHSPAFSNADYIHVGSKVLVELKILEKDHFREGGWIYRFHGFVPKPLNTDEKGLGLYTLPAPPDGGQDSFEEPLRRVLKKANRQLKESNRHLLDATGTGFIVLVANGFSSLHPESLYRMIQELLSEEFGHIVGMMLLFPTWALYREDGELAHPLCYMSCAAGSSQEQINLLCELCEKWLNFMGNGGHTPALIV